MGSDDGLVLVGVIQALDVVKVGNVEGSDVVAEGEAEVGELSIVRDVGVDGQGVLGLVAKVVEELGDALVALLVLAKGVDDPGLAGTDGTADCQRRIGWNVVVTYVAIAALSLLPGMNLTSWMPWPCDRVRYRASVRPEYLRWGW